jgi:hypothetical protein
MGKAGLLTGIKPVRNIRRKRNDGITMQRMPVSCGTALVQMA